jgi:hypothetical protein
MKNTLIAAALLTLTSAVVAQTSIALSIPATNVSLSANQWLYETCPGFDKLTTTIDVKNISTVTHTYDVTRYDIKLNSAGSGDDAQAYFCFAGQCYDNEMLTSAMSLVLAPGQSASSVGQQYFALDADYREASVAGLSIVKYTFFNTNNHNDSIQVTFRYNDLTTVGIIQTHSVSRDIQIFPNPAGNLTNLSVTGSGEISNLTILNSIGELVYEKTLPATEKNTVQINVQNLAAGVYFVQVREGKFLTTRKLIIE